MATSGKQYNERAKPGTTGADNYFRVVILPSDQFVSFKNQDVGAPGGLQRVAGRRKDGTWDTQAWLIHKNMAHLQGNDLVADHEDAKELLAQFDRQPKREKGDVFTMI